MATITTKNGGLVSSTQVDTDTNAIDVVVANVDVLSAAPASDTGQAALAVRVISQLGAGAGGGGSGLTNAELRASPVPVSGPLTDAQLRASAVPVGDGGGSLTVDGAVSVSNFPATQAVTDNGGSLTVDGTVAVSNFPASQAVTGTFWQATQPVSAASLPLPSGAATAAKQPALGTAGTASSDVITVQGIASMTALKVDGSAVAQPVTDNAGSLTVDSAQLPGALAAGGGLKVEGVAGGVAVPVSGTFWQATQPISIASAVAVTDNNSSLTVDGSVTATFTDTAVTGTITALDTVVTTSTADGTLKSGSSTAGSYVASPVPGGAGEFVVLITGLTSGFLYFEVSLDSTDGQDGNWVSTPGRREGHNSSPIILSVTANGIYRGNCAGMKYFRVRSTGASLTGTPAVNIRFAQSQGAVFLANVPAVNLGANFGKTVFVSNGSLASGSGTADQVVTTYSVPATQEAYIQWFGLNVRLSTFASTATYFGSYSLEFPAGGAKKITQIAGGSGISTNTMFFFSEPLYVQPNGTIRIVCTPSSTTAYTWVGTFGGYLK